MLKEIYKELFDSIVPSEQTSETVLAAMEKAEQKKIPSIAPIRTTRRVDTPLLVAVAAAAIAFTGVILFLTVTRSPLPTQDPGETVATAPSGSGHEAVPSSVYETVPDSITSGTDRGTSYIGTDPTAPSSPGTKGQAVNTLPDPGNTTESRPEPTTPTDPGTTAGQPDPTSSRNTGTDPDPTEPTVQSTTTGTTPPTTRYPIHISSPTMAVIGDYDRLRLLSLPIADPTDPQVSPTAPHPCMENNGVMWDPAVDKGAEYFGASRNQVILHDSEGKIASRITIGTSATVEVKNVYLHAQYLSVVVWNYMQHTAEVLVYDVSTFTFPQKLYEYKQDGDYLAASFEEGYAYLVTRYIPPADLGPADGIPCTYLNDTAAPVSAADMISDGGATDRAWLVMTSLNVTGSGTFLSNLAVYGRQIAAMYYEKDGFIAFTSPNYLWDYGETPKGQYADAYPCTDVWRFTHQNGKWALFSTQALEGIGVRAEPANGLYCLTLEEGPWRTFWDEDGSSWSKNLNGTHSRYYVNRDLAVIYTAFEEK